MHLHSWGRSSSRTYRQIDTHPTGGIQQACSSICVMMVDDSSICMMMVDEWKIFIFFFWGDGGCFLVPSLQFDLTERDGVCYSDIVRDASMHYVRRSKVPNPTNMSLQGVSLCFLLLLLGSVFF